MEFAGLPLHVLVVHAAVVLIPLTTLLVAGFAVLPGWRWLSRWPATVASLACVGIAYVASRSGEALEEQRGLEQLVRTHAERGHLLVNLTLAFAVLVVAGAFVLPGPSGLASGKGAMARKVSYADRVLAVLLVVAAAVVLVQVVLVGDSGARAVWRQ
jgi:hypothetical protein